MTHKEGIAGLRLTEATQRKNDDGRGWTVRGDHPQAGPVVLGVRAEPFTMSKRVFGKSRAYMYQVFISYRGKELNFRQRTKPTLEQVYDWTGYQIQADTTP